MKHVPAASHDARHAINFSWLLKLRWGAIAGQLLTIVVVDQLMAVALPLLPLLSIVAIEVGSNVGAWLWQKRRARIAERDLGILLALDVALLTGLLFFTGGSFNPFSFLYLVHLALAAVVLRPRWTWALAALALACSAALFFGGAFWTAEGAHPPSHAMHMHMERHLEGMWVAFGVASAFIVYFVSRIQRALAEREADLASERAAAVLNERLASLATLAAGAAHELATPLSPIAVVGRALERAAERGQNAALEDVRLIRSEVERCRQILDQMSADAGLGTGEVPVATDVAATLRTCCAALPDQPRVQIAIEGDEPLQVMAPPRALGQAITAVVKNAQEASPAGATVTVTASRRGEEAEIAVTDAGPGISPDILGRVGEPFFTTKLPGKGMGLGLFLTRTVLERIGGRMQIFSGAGGGTEMRLSVPLAESARPLAESARPLARSAQPSLQPSRPKAS